MRLRYGKWFKAFVLGLLVALGQLSEGQGAQVSLKSGDVLVGKLSPNIIRFDVKGQSYSFPLQDLEEWRAHRLVLTDGTMLTGARFLDQLLEVSTTNLGPLKVSSQEIVFLSFRVTPSSSTGSAVSIPTLSDFQKEAIKAISAITLQFVLIAVGVFSLAGTYLARSSGDVIRPLPSLFAAGGLLVLALSVIAGYFVHSGIIGQLESQRFSAYGPPTQWMAAAQLGLFVLGVSVFGAVVWRAAFTRGMEFRVHCRGAKRVTIVGTFNNWGNIAGRSRYRMYRRPFSFTWKTRLVLPSGTYEYLFLVETKGGIVLWLADPYCLRRVPNQYGGENCVLAVV